MFRIGFLALACTLTLLPQSAQCKPPSESAPGLREGMQWTGTFARGTPDELNAYRIKKKVHHPTVGKCVLKITKVNGNAFAGEFTFFDTHNFKRAAEFAGALGRREEYQLHFTRTLKGDDVAPQDCVIAGSFSADYRSLTGNFKKLSTGRVGLLEGMVLHEPEGEKKSSEK